MPRKQQKYRGYALPAEVVAVRHAKAASGAAGTHADQNARRLRAAGATNRVGSRRARTAAAVRDQRD